MDKSRNNAILSVIYFRRNPSESNSHWVHGLEKRDTYKKRIIDM
jgi:hypothetical protein